jgi:hypothetical protein
VKSKSEVEAEVEAGSRKPEAGSRKPEFGSGSRSRRTQSGGPLALIINVVIMSRNIYIEIMAVRLIIADSEGYLHIVEIRYRPVQDITNCRDKP